MTFDINDNNIIKGHPGTSNSVVFPSNVISIIDGTGAEYVFFEFNNTEFSLSFETSSKLTRIGNYSFDFSNANSLN